MKYMNIISNPLIALLIAGSLGSTATFPNDKTSSGAPPSDSGEPCSEYLTTSSKLRYRFGKVSQFEMGLFGDESETPLVQKGVTYLFASILQKEGRLPTGSEIRDYISKAVKRRASEIYADSKATPIIFDGEQDGPRYTMNDALKEAESELHPYVLKLLKNSDQAIGPGGIFKNVTELFASLGEHFPDIFEAYRGKIYKQAFLFFRHRMRPPTIQELARILKFEDPKLLAEITQQPGFWDEGLFSDIGRHLDYARKRIKTAYARTLRGTDTPAAFRTRRTPPELERVVEVMALTKSNEHYRWRTQTGDYGRFEIAKGAKNKRTTNIDSMMAELTLELRAILGEVQIPNDAQDFEERWAFDMPVLFPGGINEVQSLSRSEFQPTFTSFEDTDKFSAEYADIVRQKVIDSPGLLISSVTPGWEIDWDLLNGMIQRSKDKGYPIILIPSTGSMQDLDPDLLNNPNIDILTNSIENKEFLLSHLPTNGSAKPLDKFKKPGMFKIGQQIIVASHIFAHESIPTAKNSLNQTQVFATGTINKPKVPAVGKFQKAKAIEIAAQTKRGFLVAEKGDRGLANEYGGVTNAWHVRPVEYKHPLRGAPGVFVDIDSAYTIQNTSARTAKVKKEKINIATIYAPDVHFLVANPRVLAAFKQLLAKLANDGVQVTIIMPDPIESKAINHHVEKKQQDKDALNRLVTSGQIFFEDEVNDAISSVNVLLNEFPGVTVVFQYSNHSDEWIQRNLVNQPTWLQLISNGPLIDEIRLACRRNGWTPLEYLLLHRKAFLERTSLDGNDSYKDGATFISDTSRVRTMRIGEPITTAPDNDDWQVALQHHGHQGANGGRSSFRTHSMGEARSITGDAHRPGYYGYGSNYWVGVGAMSLEQPFTLGGYSGWDGTLALVSSYNTIQPIKFDFSTLSFMQRPEVGILPGTSFFGDDPLGTNAPMDNDSLRRERDHDEFMNWILRDSEWIAAGRLRAPLEPNE